MQLGLLAAGVEVAAWGIARSMLLLLLVIVRAYCALLDVVGSGAIAAALLLIAGLFAIGWLAGRGRPRVRSALALGAASRNIGAALVPAAHLGAIGPQVITMLVVGTLVIVFLTVPAAMRLKALRAR